jgi:hypothetical protein
VPDLFFVNVPSVAATCQPSGAVFPLVRIQVIAFGPLEMLIVTDVPGELGTTLSETGRPALHTMCIVLTPAEFTPGVPVQDSVPTLAVIVVEALITGPCARRERANAKKQRVSFMPTSVRYETISVRVTAICAHCEVLDVWFWSDQRYTRHCQPATGSQTDLRS